MLLQLALDFGQLFPDLRQRALDVRPVEAHGGRSLLEPAGLEQRWQGGDYSRQGPAASLAALDPFPRFGLTQIEQMRMAAAHFPLQMVRHFACGELLPLLGDHQLKGEVEQEVAHFAPDGLGIAVAERLVQLERFLDQVRPQRLPSLRAVPGAPPPEIAHHRQSTSKR